MTTSKTNMHYANVFRIEKPSGTFFSSQVNAQDTIYNFERISYIYAIAFVFQK